MIYIFSTEKIEQDTNSEFVKECNISNEFDKNIESVTNSNVTKIDSKYKLHLHFSDKSLSRNRYY